MRRVLTALLLALVGLAASAAADVVRMKSGDVVSGKIEKITDDELTIDPPFSDPFDVKLKYIASIVTERPVKVTFKDGRELTGYVELGPDGEMQVRAAPSRWETKHADDEWRIVDRPAPLVAGATARLDEMTAVKELEIAYYRYEAEIGLGFNAASGNTDSSSFDFSAGFTPEWGPNTIQLSGSLNQRSSNGELNAKNWAVGLQYQRDLPRDWFTLLLTAHESDPFQNLDLRSVYGFGGGYRFFDMDPTHLSTALGLGYIQENFSGASPDRDLSAVFWNLAFEREFFDADFTIYHQDTLMQALTRSELLIKTTQGIKLDLFGDFDLKLEFDYDYNSDPAFGVLEKSDYRYIVKLDYTFEGDETDWWH